MPSKWIAGTPVPMPRPKAITWGGKDTRVMRVVSNYGPVVKWKEAIEWNAVRWKLKPIAGPLAISLHFTLGPSQSLLKKDGSFRKNAREMPVAQRDGDCDNLGKAVLDALQGYVYENDSQIVDLHVCKDWGTEPGVKVYWEGVK